MPEYLAPGVYVEERSFRSKSIEGVGTTTTGFVGGTRYGPTDGEPELMTSFSQFERIYGGLDPLDYSGLKVHNYLAHAVRAFFDNGGSRLYIARAYTLPTTGTGRAAAPIPAPAPEIAEADALAVSGTTRVLSALGAAVRELEKAKAAAITVMRYAAEQVIAARSPATPAPTITYDYGTGGNVVTQLNAFIATLAGAEQTAVQDALDAVQALLNNAQTSYQNARDELTEAGDAQTAVSGAYASGVAAGSNTTTIPNEALPEDSSAGSASTIAPLNTAVSAVETEAEDLGAESASLTTALGAMVDDATAGTVVTEANDLTTAAGQVIDEANNVVTPVTNAAREATIGRRAALVHADATFQARFPGMAGNMTVTITGRLAANALITQAGQPAVSQVRNGDLVVIERGANAFLYSATRTAGVWSFTDRTGAPVALSSLIPGTDHVYPLALTVQVDMPGQFAQPMVWDRLTVSSLPERLTDSATQVFASSISNRMQELETPLVLNATGILAAELAGFLINLADWKAKLDDTGAADRLIRIATYELSEGSDGGRPEASAYEGAGDDSTPVKSGLKSFEDLEDISIIAAPGYSHDYATRQSTVDQINQHLISHCERMLYRVAVLDSPNNQSLSNVRDYRAVMDSKYAAVYYPWVHILDPVSNREIDVPPSGFICGIYARNDNENGVHKAPANEVVRGAIGLESLINKAQQDVLNPLGINCIRYFEGRGFNVWGARTISSDPEWKYLNVRRYFVYLEASIDRSTQWAVFEPNGDALWANVRRAVEDFLYNEWKEERLYGRKPEEAFFVRCDRSTMTQNDLDNGRMICLVGVAPLYPAEFVIFRIGQWTADRR